MGHLDDDHPELRVELLGPLRLFVDGGAVEVRGVRRRAALAILVLARGRVVPTQLLIDALWGDSPPAQARPALNSLLSRVRTHLGPHAARLVREGDGYRFPLADGEADVTEARALVDRARSSSADDPVLAAELLGAARRLWRGSALSEFADIEALWSDALALEELLLGVEEDELAAALAADPSESLVERTAAAMAARPEREARLLLHLRALARDGRTAEALRAASAYRRALAEETGLEPTSALAALESSIAAGAEERPAEPATHRAVERTELRTTVAPPPRYRSELLGRAVELAALDRLLAQEHLVALVGPPGVGKTRLATEVAHRAAGAGSAEVTFVSLGALGPSASLSSALAGALGIRVGPRQTALAACVERINVADHLVVLDNAEHVLGAVRDLIAELTASCPDLRVLLTSRMPTGLTDEQVVRLSPLDVAGPESAAVQLFVDRARRVRPGFEPGAGDHVAMVDLVQRLDGLPLAIELAAGRMSTLSLEVLTGRLDGALDLLGGTAAGGEPRTLRTTLSWSYDLLGAPEQLLLRHLAVFPDGVGLDGIERLAATLALPLDGMVELATLVDASLVDAHLEGEPRYQLLETIRALALDHQRAEPGEAERAQTALLGWAVAMAADIDAAARSAAETTADRRLRRELANLRAAHQLALEAGEIDAAVSITVSLDVAASFRDLPEVWTWALRLADWPDIEAHPRWLEVLGAAAEAAWLQGDLDRGAALAETGLASDPDCSRCLHSLATVSMFRGHPARALELWQTAAVHEGMYLPMCSLAAGYAGDVDTAWDCHRRAVEWATVHGSLSDLAFAHYAAGEIRSPEAQGFYETAIGLARRSGCSFVEGIALVGLSSLHAAEGRHELALDGYGQAIRYWRGTGNWTQQWTTLRNLAVLLDQRGEWALAAVIEASAAVATEASAVADAPRRLRAAEAAPLPRTEVVQQALEAVHRLLA